jgi:cysteine desulfurase family protein (TIGR01976 family)
MTEDVRSHFPGLVDGEARFDGPAGTLVVDQVIEAMTGYLRSPATANLGGAFAASVATGEVVQRSRAAVARLLGADAGGIVFGANMTTLTFAFVRALARGWAEDDEIVCTELDHDANVTPWRMAATDRGARVVMAPLDRETGRLPVEAVTACLTDRTRWVAVSGASNLLGTIPDITGITAAAHAAGARVFVDAVHLAPHRSIDISAIGCDALVTSPYKWYGPHSGVLALDPELLAMVEPYKVRPAPDLGPGRLETGTPSFEAIAGIGAAADYLLDVGLESIAAAERGVFAALLDGLLALDRVTVHGPRDLVDRTPTVLFSVDGVAPKDAAAELARARVAVWPGHSYAVEATTALGLVDQGVGVRAGVVHYVSLDDVNQLLSALEALTTR